MSIDEAEIVRRRLSAALGIALEATMFEGQGIELPCVRLKQPHHQKIQNYDEELFSIVLNRHVSFADTTLVMDRNAGYLVRMLQYEAEKDPLAWLEFVERQPEEIEILLRVNEELITGNALPTDVWRSLEIQVRKRIPLSDKNNAEKRAIHLSECASISLSLILMTEYLERLNPSQENYGLPEGARETVVTNRYERRPYNRNECIRHYGYQCWTCDMKFSETYEGLGEDYIEVHHVVPVSQLGDNYLLNPIEDLVPLCSNCHSMIHWPNQHTFRTPAELRKILQKPPKVENPFKKWDNYE